METVQQCNWKTVSKPCPQHQQQYIIFILYIEVVNFIFFNVHKYNNLASGRYLYDMYTSAETNRKQIQFAI